MNPSRNRLAPDPDKFVSVQTADGLPNDRFISSLKWADVTDPKLYDGQPYYQLVAIYQPPASAARLEAYKQFLRDEMTSWCQWATPIVEWRLEAAEGRVTRRTLTRIELLCGDVLAGDFTRTTGHGVPALPQGVGVIQAWNGCNWGVTSGTKGQLTMRLSGPLDLAK